MMNGINSMREALEALKEVQTAIKKAYEQGYNEGKERTKEKDEAYDYLKRTIQGHANPCSPLLEALDKIYLRYTE
jgi:ArsR family metal-binding transcriptional regulator